MKIKDKGIYCLRCCCQQKKLDNIGNSGYQIGKKKGTVLNFVRLCCLAIYLYS